MPVHSRLIPLGLKNLGQNVCFFNSLIQALYSLKSFREFVFESSNSNSGMVTLSELFTSMTTSKAPIETYHQIPSFEITGYEHHRFQQFDAQEGLIYMWQFIGKKVQSYRDYQ